MKNKEEIDYYKSKLFYDNDASASAFGFRFQADAGLYLFCEFFEDAKEFMIESALQDIEIIKKDNTKILCQAKAAQNPNGNVNYSNKLHDALLSLSRNYDDKSNEFIYITNFDSPLGKEMISQFNNKLVNYNELKESAKEIIDRKLVSIRKQIDDKINSDDMSAVMQEKLKKTINNIDNFNKEKLMIISITRYFGNDYYKTISERLSELLSEKFNMEPNKIGAICRRVYNLLHNIAEINETEKDVNGNKKLTKEDFCWPIIVAGALSVSPNDIKEYMDGKMDDDLSNSMELYKNEMLSNYDYELVNKLVNEYDKFSSKESRLKNFILQHWKEYKKYFPNSDPLTNKALTIFYMYSILSELSITKKVLKGKEL